MCMISRLDLQLCWTRMAVGDDETRPLQPEPEQHQLTAAGLPVHGDSRVWGVGEMPI